MEQTAEIRYQDIIKVLVIVSDYNTYLHQLAAGKTKIATCRIVKEMESLQLMPGKAAGTSLILGAVPDIKPVCVWICWYQEPVIL